jgi:4'-phosphopantetheinyl transferase
MLQWLIQSTTAHSALALGMPPPGLLGASELRRLAELKTAKRRRDWLLGRWTAKHLIQSYLERSAGVYLPLDAIVVASDLDGAPRLSVDCRSEIAGSEHNLQSAICNLQVSISHSNGLALCAITDQPGTSIGADIEQVEPRAPGFAHDYFTAHELDQLYAAPSAEKDAITTVIWSAKEAALKALRLGLTVDTRAVSCTLATSPGGSTGWAGLAVRCDTVLLGRPADELAGWWWVGEGYVLTIAFSLAGSLRLAFTPFPAPPRQAGAGVRG